MVIRIKKEDVPRKRMERKRIEYILSTYPEEREKSSLRHEFYRKSLIVL